MKNLRIVLAGLLVVTMISAAAPLFAAPTAEEVAAAVAVFDKMMAPYQKDADGNIVSFDLTDRICGNEELATICKLDTVTNCKIYGANLKPGGAKVITNLKNCKKLSIENTDFRDDDMAFLVDMPWVEELTLRRNTYLGAEALRYVAKMPKLRNLVLLYGNFDDAALLELAPVKTLRLLDIRGCSRVTDAGLAVLKEFPNLIVFKLRCTAVSNFGIENIRGKNLKTFGIEDSQTYDDNAIELLTTMTKSMQELTIMRCPAIGDDGIKKIAALTDMRKLNLRGNYIGSDALEGCKDMPNLTLLCVSETFVDSAALPFLAKADKLNNADFWHTDVSDENLEVLAKLPALKILRLDGTKITDAGIAKLVGSTSLENLNLSENQLTDACVDSLCKIKTLKSLSIRATQISEAGREKIKAALPNCQVAF